jgi:hypothetical protein
MKLLLEVPTTWTAEHLADGRRRYLVPGGASADLVVLVRESLPLPIDLAAWPLAALSPPKLAPGLPAGLGASPGAAKRRVNVHSSLAQTTTGGWPATLVEATLVDEHNQPVAGCLAALYRFLSYGAEAVVIASDRARLLGLRETLLKLLATGRPQWTPGEPPSLHHLLHDEPT